MAGRPGQTDEAGAHHATEAMRPCPYCGSDPDEDWVYVPENDDDHSSDEFCMYSCPNPKCVVRPQTILCFSAEEARREWLVISLEWMGDPNPIQRQKWHWNAQSK